MATDTTKEKQESLPEAARGDVRRISDIVPPDTLWPELPQLGKRKLVDAGDFVCLEAKVRSKRVDAVMRDFYVCRCVAAEGNDTDVIGAGELFTTILGGEVIFKKIAAVIEANGFPFLFAVIKPGRYFDLT